ncbi:MAG: DUF5343 domain-containing protein [Anaerolineae bacterium]
MADFPYTQVTGKLKSFFEKVQQVGKPDTVDKKWLASIGLKATNDHTIIPVLRFIGFVDQSSKPTDRWMSYRDKSRAGKVLAEGVLEGYAELFQTYAGAHRRSDEELKAFFSTKTTAGAQVVSKTVTTFKTLCGLADFEGVSVEGPPVQPVQLTQDGLGAPTKIIKELGAGVTININIQLTLPDTTDESVYDKLFSAMKRHLLS